MLVRRLLAAVLSISIFPCCANAERRERTVQGPETDQLLSATNGYLLMDPPSRGIIAIHLPSLRETVVWAARPPGPEGRPTIHALSGPDRTGRIAYIEDYYFVPNEKDRRHLLKTINLDGGEETELFSRPGDAMWATTAAGRGEIGKHLALSPVGGRIAILSGLTSVQMPGALLYVGSVEIWDVEEKEGRKTEIKAVDDPLAWFPDGKRLAYVKLVEREVVADRDQEDGSFGEAFRRWDRIPAVFVHDVHTGTESFLHVGWRPVVSFDGRSILVSDLQGSRKLVEVTSGKSHSIKWPGNAGAIAMPAEDVVLSWCLPTEGTEIRYTEHNSPLVGPKLMLSLKLARLSTGEFQTVVPHVDPRRRVSFGAVEEHIKGATNHN